MRLKLGKIVYIFIVLLGLLDLLFLPVKAEELITNPLDELLPPIIYDPGHDPTYPLQEPEWYYDNSWTETLMEPGFEEGKARAFYKRFYLYSDMSVEFYVYRFSNISSAEEYFNKEINQIKSEGDYTEVSIYNAFGVKFNYDIQEVGVSWGFINNIVFKVEVITDGIVEDPTDQLIEFTLLQRFHILECGIISEFSFYIILPLFMITTLLTIIIIKRKIHL